MLSLNHLGLVERGAGRSGQALREILSLFADLSDSATERSIRGMRSVDSRPIVRRIRQRSGFGAARGIEVTVTFDEKAFEGSGVFLLGAVLDRFFAEYAALNHFTADVIAHRRARRDHALAAARRRAEAAVSFIATSSKRNPGGFDFFAVLRRLERSHPDKPRIGDSAVAPRGISWRSARTRSSTFRPRTSSEFERRRAGPAAALRRSSSACSDRRARCRSRRPRKPITGRCARDDAFPRFLDIFNHRFLQLFFRAWADARPIAQHDRPDDDRFAAYLGSLHRHRLARLSRPRLGAGRRQAAFAGLLGAAGEIGLAAARLHRRAVRRRRSRSTSSSAPGSPSSQATGPRLGKSNSALGVDTLLGASVYSVRTRSASASTSTT